LASGFGQATALLSYTKASGLQSAIFTDNEQGVRLSYMRANLFSERKYISSNKQKVNGFFSLDQTNFWAGFRHLSVT
jgi:hypothetical protein